MTCNLRHLLLKSHTLERVEMIMASHASVGALLASHTWRGGCIMCGLILPDGQSCQWYAGLTHCLSVRMCSDFESPCRVRTVWRRLIRCLKLQVIFCKRATNYWALLRKMTCKDKASYDSTPPCRNAARPCKVTLDVMCRVAWSHRMPYLYRSFFAKEPNN